MLAVVKYITSLSRTSRQFCEPFSHQTRTALLAAFCLVWVLQRQPVAPLLLDLALQQVRLKQALREETLREQTLQGAVWPGTQKQVASPARFPGFLLLARVRFPRGERLYK
jgi:hypothetical protein